MDERTAREMALAGDGGGGIPLPPVFTAVVQELLDNGLATTGRLEEVVTASVKLKEVRVVKVWRSWERFTRAILDQLTDEKIIEPEGANWWLPPSFTPNKRYAVMGKWNIGFTVYDKKTRQEREDRTQVQILAREFAGRLARHGEIGEKYAALASAWADHVMADNELPPGRKRHGHTQSVTRGSVKFAALQALYDARPFWKVTPQIMAEVRAAGVHPKSPGAVAQAIRAAIESGYAERQDLSPGFTQYRWKAGDFTEDELKNIFTHKIKRRTGQ
jgi:hypothetical protein